MTSGVRNRTSFDIQLEFNDFTRKVRRLHSLLGTLSSDWKEHVFDLEFVTFALNVNVERCTTENGLHLRRDGQEFSAQLLRRRVFVEELLLPLVGGCLGDDEWADFVTLKGSHMALNLHNVGVDVAPLRACLLRAAQNEGDALGVATKVKLGELALLLTAQQPKTREIEQQKDRNVRIARCLGVSDISYIDTITAVTNGAFTEPVLALCSLAMQMGVPDAPTLIADVVVPFIRGKNPRVISIYLRFLEEALWVIERNVAKNLSEILDSLSDFVAAHAGGNRLVEELVGELASFWILERTEPRGFAYALSQIASLGQIQRVLSFLVAWNKWGVVASINKLTMLSHQLPMIQRAAGGDGRQFSDVLKTFQRLLKSRVDITQLVLVTSMLEPYGVESFPSLFSQLEKKFLTRKTYGSLLYLRLLGGYEQIKRAMIEAGMRSDVQLFYSLPSLLEMEVLKPLADFVLRYGQVDGPSRSEFSTMCHLIAMLGETTNEKAVTQLMVNRIQRHVVDGTFAAKSEQLFTDASRMALFVTLFSDRLAVLREQDASESEYLQTFKKAFPRDVLDDEKVLGALSMLSKRVVRVRNHRPKYSHVCDLSLEMVSKFLQSDQTGAQRREVLSNAILELPANQEEMSRLIKNGYHPFLFHSGISTLVSLATIDTSESQFRTQLLALLEKYIPLLKENGIEKVGEAEISKLFDSFSSFEQLQGERALVVRCLPKSPRVQNLLEREAILTRDCELAQQKQSGIPSELKTFRIRLNNSLIYAMQTCGTNIKGCYSPTGVHAEKPIECGLKVNNRLWSIMSVDGEEIESLETVFTEEGMFVFRGYSSDHKFDTAMCWASLFQRLLIGGYVPQIIVPRGYPSERTFRLLNDAVPSSFVRVELTFRDELFDDSGVPSYYDGETIDAVKPGDLILTAENVKALVVPKGEVDDEIILQRSHEFDMPHKVAQMQSKRTKSKKKQRNLAQEVLRRTMLRMKSHETFQGIQCNALGRHVSEYVAKYAQLGQKDVSVLLEGFNWQRFLGNDVGTIKAEDAVACIVDLVDDVFATLYDAAGTEDMFFQMRSHFKAMGAQDRFRESTRVLKQRIELQVISELPLAAQQSLLRRAFRNEGRVWLLRGGRPGNETVDAFLALAKGPADGSTETGTPGVALYDGDEMIGYCLGEWISANPKTYEVITAWVNTRYKGMGLALKMYFRVLEIVTRGHGTVLKMDLIEGGVDRTVARSLPLRALVSCGAQSLLVQKRERSYSTEREQFEAIWMYTRTLYFLYCVLWFFGLVRY